MKKTGSKTATFEENLERLASIAEQVEDGQTPLEAAIALYKEGLELAGKCGETLRKYEAEVLTLQKEADETFTLELFTGGQ